jgi:hypothetical protein
MRVRLLAALWALLGVAIWCGIFDLYVSRGAREYGQVHAEFELHMTQVEPKMMDIMDRAQHDGVVAASIWATVVVALGWTTLWLADGRRSR